MDKAWAVATADLSRIVVDVAAAARDGARSSRVAVQHTIAALALSVVVHDRFTAT